MKVKKIVTHNMVITFYAIADYSSFYYSMQKISLGLRNDYKFYIFGAFSHPADIFGLRQLVRV